MVSILSFQHVGIKLELLTYDKMELASTILH